MTKQKKIIISEQQFKTLIKLIEGKDYVYGTYNGIQIETGNEDWDAIPFFYANNKVYVGYNPELGIDYKEAGYFDGNGENDYPNFHSDIDNFYRFIYNETNNNIKKPIQKLRNSYEYLGRLWFDSEVISFWKYPEDKNILKKILSLLKKEIIDIYDFEIDFSNYIIEVDVDKYDSKLVSVKDYVSGKNATEEEMMIPHLMPARQKSNTPQMKAAINNKYKNISNKLGNVTQAEYNFYKNYGIGDSIIPKKKLIR